MIINVHRVKSWISSVLLIAFSGAFVCDTLCAFEIIQIKSCLSYGICSIEDNSESDNNHSLDKDHSHHQVIESADTQHHGGDTHKEDCCDDMTSNFYSSIHKQKVNEIDIDPDFFVLYFTSLSHYSFNQNSSDFLISYSNFKPPPPITGVEIRILVQSFLS